ncbi:sugar nucleotide-binding protein [Patescibacteria group bacterium]|nr:sugar nucleotide-binding protein [Patescibacteria group bacterium]
MQKKITLVLGADGMVGHTVYSYLSRKFPGTVFGTSRNNSKFFLLDEKNLEKDFLNIEKKYKIDFVINCIGILKDKDVKTTYFVNSEFPKKLARLSDKNNFKLIHISSDAVFSPISGRVTEKTKPNPKDDYGKSKLKGEPKNKNTLSIRTSFLGFDALKNKGLLEWAINSKNEIHGYSNQAWSGCTTLQFAALCEFLIKNNNFTEFRKKSGIFHFAPLGPTTKYEILLELMEVLGKKTKVKKTNSDIMINRFLSSVYFDNKFIKNYTTEVKAALLNLIKFEKDEQ